MKDFSSHHDLESIELGAFIIRVRAGIGRLIVIIIGVESLVVAGLYTFSIIRELVLIIVFSVSLVVV